MKEAISKIGEIEIMYTQSEAEAVRVWHTPAPVGYWVSYDGHVNFGIYKKPKWLWRKMVKILLGWDYRDDKKLEGK